MEYKLNKDIKQDEELRNSFNELTEKTYCFNFVEWYQNGYWGDQYIPFTLVEGDKVIANVSVNLMDFTVDGVKKKYIQLGTVMTDEAYRNQGLGKYLIEVVLKEYENKVDGIYLFGNDSVLHYYPKFGFTESKEYEYRKMVDFSDAKRSANQIDMKNSTIRDKVLDVVKSLAVNSNLSMDNYGLYTFWLTGWQSDKIYECVNEDAYVVADIQGEILYLNQIIAKHVVDLDSIIASFGNGIKEVVLGFVPLDTTGYEVKEHKEEDCTLFVLGEDLAIIENQKLRFPVLSHA